MINIELEVKVNGKPVKVTGKLNDLIAWFITQRLVSEEGTIASFASPKIKSSKAGKPKILWTEEQENKLIQKTSELRQQGKTWNAINAELQPVIGKSYGAIWAKLNKFRSLGKIR